MSQFDTCTNDKSTVSCGLVVERILDKLGFRKSTLGTKYFKDFIVYAYNKNDYDFFVNRTITEFLKDKKLTHISKKKYIDNMNYAIKNVDIYKFKDNFYSIFHTEYNLYYLTIKNITILIFNCLNRYEQKKHK